MGDEIPWLQAERIAVADSISGRSLDARLAPRCEV
ncbi:uncharacterized protein SOCEGT47_006880 [Sorangium cellulosum]|uniref:Uncharacterized protein n=1 Tax=Sorangium cellulosum TaxID=56 RepID=A0A4P2PUZ1_SORCE|nr:uncharacterized protein SOCEGT47_006880 [Sorangium cellulosum]